MKVSAEIIHKAVRIILKHKHLSTMRLAHAMALKTIFISTCLLTHLAIPSQLCQSLGFDAIAYGLRSEKSTAFFGLPHSIVIVILHGYAVLSIFVFKE